MKNTPAPADSWMGWSNGRWEGETLVIDTTGFNDLSWFDRAGNFHSDQLHVVERITATGPDHLSYEATIEDPQTFTRPWKITMGNDPKTSVVNRYGQSWDVPNLFIVGSSTFPTMSGFNPTLTIQALAYTSADAIVKSYRNKPGPLV